MKRYCNLLCMKLFIGLHLMFNYYMVCTKKYSYWAAAN